MQMFLRYWGVREDGEYSPTKNKPRPGWSYRCERRNAARLAHWPSRIRWRRVPLAVKAMLWARRIQEIYSQRKNQMATA